MLITFVGGSLDGARREIPGGGDPDPTLRVPRAAPLRPATDAEASAATMRVAYDYYELRRYVVGRFGSVGMFLYVLEGLTDEEVLRWIAETLPIGDGIMRPAPRNVPR